MKLLSALLLLGLTCLVTSNGVFKAYSPGSHSKRVVYKIGDLKGLPFTEKEIKASLDWFRENTCIDMVDFRDAPNEKVNMPIVPNGDCQVLNGNFYIGDCIGQRTIVAHEVMHWLGLAHTQNRPDWSNYLTAAPGYKLNLSHPSVYAAPTKYDYGSIMHYDLYGDGCRTPCTIPMDQNYNRTLGQRVRIPFSDAMTLNWLYACSASCSVQPKCQNGGITHPRDCTKCMCNKYFTGNLCQTPKQVVQLSCQSEASRTHAIKISESKNMSLVKKLNDDFMNPRDDLWVIVEAPAGTTVQVEVGTRSGKFPRPNEGCSLHAVEVNDSGDLNMTGKMFCMRQVDGQFEPAVQFTTKNNRIGYHIQYVQDMFVVADLKFTLKGC